MHADMYIFYMYHIYIYIYKCIFLETLSGPGGRLGAGPLQPEALQPFRPRVLSQGGLDLNPQLVHGPGPCPLFTPEDPALSHPEDF